MTAERREAGFEAVIGAAAAPEDRPALLALAEGIERSLLRAGCPAAEARRLATVRLVASLICERALAGRPLRSARGPISRAARFTGLPQPAVQAMVGHIALRETRTIAQPPLEAIQTQLGIAASLASLREASCWLAGANGGLSCAAQARGRPSAGVARVARRAFATAAQTPVGARRELVAVPLAREAAPFGALAARTVRGGAGAATMTLRAAVPLIGQVLQRKALVEAAEARGANVASAAERALVRFGFDVHDGPAQGIAALQAEIRELEAQVTEVFARDPRAALLLGRLQDLEAHSASVARQIRSVANSARPAAAPEQPVAEVLRRELRELRGATGIEACLDLSGPVDETTPSQRIALLRGVQEALRNVREHSLASHVGLRVAACENWIEAEVSDDGRGFDPERARSRASRAGRMGLAGIVERARLLGGHCEIRSSPGGPTAVRMTLPRWKPPRG
jgi:signal transduction histidine kinase